MVKSTHFRERHDVTIRQRLNTSWRGCVVLKGEMGSRPMIIGDVSSKHATQMCLAQNDDVIQTFAAQRSDQSLRVRILPRTGRGRDDFGDADAGDTTPEHIAVDGVAIP